MSHDQHRDDRVLQKDGYHFFVVHITYYAKFLKHPSAPHLLKVGLYIYICIYLYIGLCKDPSTHHLDG